MDQFPRRRPIEDLLERRNTEEARRAIEKVLRKNPDDIFGLYYLALCEYYDSDRDEAEKVVKKLLKKSDQFAPAQHLLGLISEEKGDQDAACHAFQAALEGGWKPAGAKLDQYRVAMKQAGGKPPTFRKADLKLDTKKRQWLEAVLTGIEIPTGLKYSDQHVWIRIDDEVGTVGITDFFRFTQNPDYVWVDELPKVDSMIEFGQIISKITGLVNPELRKPIYPKETIDSFSDKVIKGENLKSYEEERKTFTNGHGFFRDPRKRIWISVPSPVSGQIVKANKSLINGLFRSRQELNLNFPYAEYSWLFGIQLNNKGWEDLEQLMDDTAYRQFVGSILISG